MNHTTIRRSMLSLSALLLPTTLALGCADGQECDSWQDCPIREICTADGLCIEDENFLASQQPVQIPWMGVNTGGSFAEGSSNVSEIDSTVVFGDASMDADFGRNVQVGGTSGLATFEDAMATNLNFTIVDGADVGWAVVSIAGNLGDPAYDVGTTIRTIPSNTEPTAETPVVVQGCATADGNRWTFDEPATRVTLTVDADEAPLTDVVDEDGSEGGEPVSDEDENGGSGNSLNRRRLTLDFEGTNHHGTAVVHYTVATPAVAEE